MITLKGSAAIVSEFFGYSINSILYQRGIYDPDKFVGVSKYGLKLLVTSDDGLSKYLENVLSQLSVWLAEGTVQQLVLVISSVETEEVLERWIFQCETDEEALAGQSKQKEEKIIMKEISAVIRQITASVTFLPLLDEPCTFDLLVFTKLDADVPRAWEESDPRYITKANEVRLRSFTTSVHKVGTSVSYKAGGDDSDDEV